MAQHPHSQSQDTSQLCCPVSAGTAYSVQGKEALPSHEAASGLALELLSWGEAVAPRGVTSMMRGLSMMRAVWFPFSTMPIIQAWCPSPYLGDLISAQKRAA